MLASPCLMVTHITYHITTLVTHTITCHQKETGEMEPALLRITITLLITTLTECLHIPLTPACQNQVWTMFIYCYSGFICHLIDESRQRQSATKPTEDVTENGMQCNFKCLYKTGIHSYMGVESPCMQKNIESAHKLAGAILPLL